MSEFRTKIGKVRAKKPVLAVVTPKDSVKTWIVRDFAAVLDSFQSAAGADGEVLAGMAVVVWSDKGSSTCILRADPDRNRIPNILVPEYVKNRLLANEIRRWSVEDTLSRLGVPTPHA